MIVLKAIGRFFARIGRWIRDTAWVQPLLIVGGIFAIIFSIPHLIKWVGGWFEDGDAATTFYTKYKVSLDGAEDEGSDVDNLLTYLENPDDAELKAKYGEKFFVSFVQEHCAECESNYEGFETLQTNWNNENKGYKIDDGKEFKFYTIFIDSLNDDNDNLFKKCFANHYEVFENAKEQYEESPYSIYKGSSFVDSLQNICDVDSFTSPTTFLIDFSAEIEYVNDFGISEIFFGVDGSTKFEKASTIADCWNHAGNFAEK